MTWEMKLDERYRQGMEKGHAEGLVAGREEGLAAGRAEMIQKLLKSGMTPEEVAKLAELSIEEVEKMKKADMVSV